MRNNKDQMTQEQLDRINKALKELRSLGYDAKIRKTENWESKSKKWAVLELNSYDEERREAMIDWSGNGAEIVMALNRAEIGTIWLGDWAQKIIIKL